MFYISQINEYDCGYATLRIALANLYHDKNALYINFNNEKKMASYYDLVELAKEYGLTLIPFKSEDSFFSESSRLPMLIEISESGNNHLVYLYHANKKYVYYLDPAKGKVKQKIGVFNAIWNKRGLLVSNYKHTQIFTKFNFIKKNESLSLFLFQIASSLCCVLGFYFMDTKYPIYLAIIMCVLFAIMEVSLRKFALILMRRIDKRIDNYSNSVKKEDFNEYFNVRQNLKKTIMVNQMSVFAGLCIIGLCIFFLTLNATINLIYVGVALILGLISGVFVNKKMITKNTKITKQESNVERVNTFDELRENINKINDLGNDYANSFLSWKFVVVSVCVITSILFMFILKLNNPAYCVFMTMIEYLMYQQFELLFTFNIRRNEKNLLLVKFNNLFQKHS